MKLKHWAGYGTVDARKIACGPDFLKVKVTGSHECGLERDDKYDVFNWLVRRFDKRRTDYFDIEDVMTDVSYEGNDEVCVYTIRFRNAA